MVGSRLKLTIAYDGARFWGSQRQAGRETVQSRLEDALSDLAERPVAVELAGRTDRGVHAAGQVASCDDCRTDLPEARIRLALEARVGDGLSPTNVERVAPGFHARYDAVWREYRYRIWAGPRAPLLTTTSWHRRGHLDRTAMADAASRLVGTHDFAS